MSDSGGNDYDVVIIGGGMAGATLACALQHCGVATGLKVLVVEATPVIDDQAPFQPGFDERSTVLSSGSFAYLETLGIGASLKTQACPIHAIHVSDAGKLGAVRLDCEEQGVDALGYTVANRWLGRVLNKVMAEAEQVTIRDATVVSGISTLRQCIRLDLERQGARETVSASLVVLADGGRSGLCETLGISRTIKSYGQTAIIANVSFEKEHENVAYERFTSQGPLALLPLLSCDRENRAALVWTVKSGQAGKLLDMKDSVFLEGLQQAFGRRLGMFCGAGMRSAYPLGLSLAEEQYRSRLVLVGNVAHALHPVAGQGFNLSMRNVMRLTRQIVSAVRNNTDPGSIPVLQGYIEEVCRDQQQTIAFSDYMTRLFSSDNQGLVWARKFGLFSIDLIPPLKQDFVRHAMGQGGSMVRLGP